MIKRVFFVVGMHRSGTSYLAQTLSYMGLELPASIQQGAPDNPKGHFESLNSAQYHDGILKEAGLSWDTFLPVSESLFEAKSKEVYVKSISETFAKDFLGKNDVVLKDPRLTLFLPLWQEYCKQSLLEDVYIIPIRHPMDVAASLNKRNGIGINEGCLIWLNYMFTGEKYTRTKKRSFIEFPQWPLRLEEAMEHIEDDLGLTFSGKNKGSLLKASQEFKQEFIHHVSEDAKPPQDAVESLAFEVYSAFKKLISDPYDRKVIDDLDCLKAKFVDAALLFTADAYKRSQKMLSEEKDRNLELEKAFDAEVIRHMALSSEHDSLAEQLKEMLSGGKDRNLELEKAFDAELIRHMALSSEHDSLAEQLKEMLREEKNRTLELEKAVDAGLIRHMALSSEYDSLVEQLSIERFTIIKPIYRNLYKSLGLVSRKLFPSTLVEWIKKRVPNPYGISKSLTYQPVHQKLPTVSFEAFRSQERGSSPDIIVLSIIDWDFRFQRPQHIAKGLAGKNQRVFYVEMLMGEQGCEINEIDTNLYRVRLSSESVGYIQPYTGRPGLSQSKAWVDAFCEFADLVHATPFKQVIIQHPFWWQLAKHLTPEFQITFDCMDDIAGFSNTEKFLVELEKDMLSKTDKLIVSSQYLFDKYKGYQEPCLVRNATELTHFEQVVKGGGEPFPLQSSSNEVGGKIKVGYVGAIAEWFDVDLIRTVALNEPSFEFHLCGGVSTKEAALLAEVENIIMYGEIAYSKVPAFLVEMDVLTIPFKILPIIEACDPVKFYEYSTLGKPTVITPLPELERVSDLTFVASTPEDFAGKIRNAYKAGGDEIFCTKLRLYAAQNTWKHRTRQFRDVLADLPLVSVVILAYGDPELTKSALKALFEDGRVYPNMEVLVVDNGSPKEAVDEIISLASQYPETKVVQNGENLGFAKGNNVGLNLALGDYVLLLNNDTYVSPGAIFAMLRHLESHKCIGAVGPLTNNIGNEAKVFVEYENMEQMKRAARQLTTGYRGVFSPISVVAYFAVMFRREDLSEFGLLSEEYGRGMFEDDDHCAMIKSKGYICALAEDAFVHHQLSATFSKLDGGEKEALFNKNKKVFEEKWGAWKAHKYRDVRPESTLEFRD